MDAQRFGFKITTRSGSPPQCLLQHRNLARSRFLRPLASFDFEAVVRAHSQALPPRTTTFRSRPTDLAVSCKAAPAPTQPAGLSARRRPKGNSRTDLVQHQDVVRAALTAAPPSWADLLPSSASTIDEFCS